MAGGSTSFRLKSAKASRNGLVGISHAVQESQWRNEGMRKDGRKREEEEDDEDERRQELFFGGRR